MVTDGQIHSSNQSKGTFVLSLNHPPEYDPHLHGGVGQVIEFIKLPVLRLKPLSKMRSDKVSALIASASPLFVASRHINGSDACERCPLGPHSAVISPFCQPLGRKSNTLNGEGKHYGRNRSWNKIKVSPITTFLHVFAAAEKTFLR